MRPPSDHRERVRRPESVHRGALDRFPASRTSDLGQPFAYPAMDAAARSHAAADAYQEAVPVVGATAGASRAAPVVGAAAGAPQQDASQASTHPPPSRSSMPPIGLSKPPRKKPGPKKKVSRAASVPWQPPPTLAPSTTMPSFCAMAASSNFPCEDTGQSTFDQMPSSQSFTEWMTDSVGLDNPPLAQTFPSVDEEINLPTKKRGQRAANYSAEEDKALIMAWQSVSLDAAIGVDQTLSTYWSRIEEQFHRNLKTPSNRSIGSLQHHWSTIQECCSKWASCKAEIERLHPSGVPLQEQVHYIQERYKQLDPDKPKLFTMLHCWALLQHNEKWRNRDTECIPKKPRSNNSSTPEFGTHEDGDDEVEGGRRSPTPSSGGSLRPPGRKKEKERQKKEGHGGSCKDAIQEMIETKKKLAIEKDARWMDIKAIEERKVAIEEEKLRMKNEKRLAKKKEQDERIMFMDISVLDVTQRAYVEARRAQILANMLGGSGSGSGPM